ncbi:LCP family protein [Actinokineospora spheciospongiae]|uniref:LCP family protein n=1 Tax=Actinokineospora spheciospongiae TaxID=909613 RepID=UPI000D71B6DC|nr:LCP family protein [Actinokineospora spheciospongiae]PWW65643.1 LytR family transcriptional attenuator [Actinokineospora spheciospongiae]
MTEHESLIRQAIAAEADQAAHPEAVLARLRGGHHRTWPRFAVIAAAVVAVVAGAVVLPSLLRGDNAGTTEQVATQPPPPRRAQNVLLAGSDANGYLDTVVLVRVGDDGSLRGVSLPRDSYTAVPGAGNKKLSHSYNTLYTQAKEGGADDRTAAAAGRDGLVATVENLTGVRADHVAIADMAGFAALADTLGGVEVCLNHATEDPYSGADFQAGPTTLTGQSALAFLRQRRGLPDGDLDRVARAQVFLRNLSAKLLTDGTLTNLNDLAALVDAVNRTVRTDPGWDLLAFAATLVGGTPLVTATIPVVGEVDTPDSGSALEVDPAAVKQFTEQQFAVRQSSPNAASLSSEPEVPTGSTRQCVN